LDLTGIQESADIDGNPVVTGKIRVVRLGALSVEQIAAVAGELLEYPAANGSSGNPEAQG
jgi:hypothetical protein